MRPLLQGEMLALQEAPGVVAVCKKFRASAAANGSHQQHQLSAVQSDSSSDTSSSDGSEAGSPRAAGVPDAGPGITIGNGSNRGSSPAAAELLVEVDVVADYGLTWIGRRLRPVLSAEMPGNSNSEEVMGCLGSRACCTYSRLTPPRQGLVPSN